MENSEESSEADWCEEQVKELTGINDSEKSSEESVSEESPKAGCSEEQVKMWKILGIHLKEMAWRNKLTR